MSLDLPNYLNAHSDEADIRLAIVHGDRVPESRNFIIKMLGGPCERPDLVPFDWPERTVTPISASGISWLLPDADGVVHQPVGQAPVDICPINGLIGSAGESVIDAIRSMRASLAGIADEVVGQVAGEKRNVDREDSLLAQRRAARRRRVHGGQSR